MSALRWSRSRSADDAADETADVEVEATEDGLPRGYTPGKGRPTPKRRESERRSHGPVAPAPMTGKEARARARANKGSKDERKAAAAARRSDASERRARMLAGEEAYLLPRDKGPVRAYVRDLVDARRNIVGMFMPLALVLIVALLLSPEIQAMVTLGMLVLMALMVIEGVFLGFRINRLVRERFPDSIDGGFKLGWYAFVRATQLRKLRAPKPRVRPGDAV